MSTLVALAVIAAWSVVVIAVGPRSWDRMQRRPVAEPLSHVRPVDRERAA